MRQPVTEMECRAFLGARDRLAPTGEDETTVGEIARHLSWSHERTVRIAWCLTERRLIDTDAGMGCDPTVIEGRRG